MFASPISETMYEKTAAMLLIKSVYLLHEVFFSSFTDNENAGEKSRGEDILSSCLPCLYTIRKLKRKNYFCKFYLNCC